MALVYPSLERPGKQYAGRIVRLNFGLEEHEDLIDDLAAALAILNTRRKQTNSRFQSRGHLRITHSADLWRKGARKEYYWMAASS